MSDTNDPLQLYIKTNEGIYRAYTKRDGHFDCDRCDRHPSVMRNGCRDLTGLGLRNVCSKSKIIWKFMSPEGG